MQKKKKKKKSGGGGGRWSCSDSCQRGECVTLIRGFAAGDADEPPRPIVGDDWN